MGVESTRLRAPLVPDHDGLHLQQLVEEHVERPYRPALQVRRGEVRREHHREVPGGQLDVVRDHYM